MLSIKQVKYSDSEIVPASVSLTDAGADDLDFAATCEKLLIGDDFDLTVAERAILNDEIFSFSEDVFLHTWIPSLNLVTEVYSRFKQTLHGYYCHLSFSFIRRKPNFHIFQHLPKKRKSAQFFLCIYGFLLHSLFLVQTLTLKS